APPARRHGPSASSPDPLSLPLPRDPGSPRDPWISWGGEGGGTEPDVQWDQGDRSGVLFGGRVGPVLGPGPAVDDQVAARDQAGVVRAEPGHAVPDVGGSRAHAHWSVASDVE